MITIISKQSGPRPEDAKAKRHIQQNWGVIEKLADHISGGQYSASKIKKPAPQPSGLIISYASAGNVTPSEIKPCLRISINGRVILMDSNSGKQLHFLGQIRQQKFVLATKENGFISKLDDELYEQIFDLDQIPISFEFTEEDLSRELNKRLGLG